jgi:hypothetical protein
MKNISEATPAIQLESWKQLWRRLLLPNPEKKEVSVKKPNTTADITSK